MRTDIEIAREASPLPIGQIAAKLDIEADALMQFGPDKAKIDATFTDSLGDRPDGHLILVTAVNPTPAGEGKTTTTVGLGDALEIDQRRIRWRRVMDMNDRALRDVVT